MAQSTKQQDFQILIEGLVRDGVSKYIDVIAEYMEENELEAKQLAKLISPTLTEKLRIEAILNRTINDADEGSILPL